MSTSKKETFYQEHVEAFLATRSPEYREKFEQKDFQKRYLSVYHWVRRHNDGQYIGSPKTSAAAVEAGAAATPQCLRLLRRAKKELDKGVSLTPAQITRVKTVMAEINEAIENYTTLMLDREIELARREADKAQARYNALLSRRN